MTPSAGELRTRATPRCRNGSIRGHPPTHRVGLSLSVLRTTMRRGSKLGLSVLGPGSSLLRQRLTTRAVGMTSAMGILERPTEVQAPIHLPTLGVAPRHALPLLLESAMPAATWRHGSSVWVPVLSSLPSTTRRDDSTVWPCHASRPKPASRMDQQSLRLLLLYIPEYLYTYATAHVMYPKVRITEAATIRMASQVLMDRLGVRAIF